MDDYQRFLDARNIEVPCKRCSGLGVRSYGSTATWHGGIGGQMVTSDVCDKCWGSGDAGSPWLSLRKVERLMKAVGNVLDHWEQIPNDIVTDPGFDSLQMALSQLMGVQLQMGRPGKEEQSEAWSEYERLLHAERERDEARAAAKLIMDEELSDCPATRLGYEQAFPWLKTTTMTVDGLFLLDDED